MTSLILLLTMDATPNSRMLNTTILLPRGSTAVTDTRLMVGFRTFAIRGITFVQFPARFGRASLFTITL